ncbi:MAG TPA: zinc-dependent metalloprotease family protein, partial [Pirellulaceae bacterium]|nr:zinc-dependent metalloprotease family protein [Pirellulaceae bacterium]
MAGFVRGWGSASRGSAPHTGRRLGLEPLEARCLLAADFSDPFAELLTHGGACGCPICTGNGLAAIAPEAATATTAAAATFSLSSTPLSVPQLSSRPGAKATLFLDFNGNVESRWGSETNAVTPAFDTDGNYSSYSAAELAAIREIWARVAEDYAPFNVNVTTVAPPLLADRVAAKIVIGGNFSDWFGSSAGGVAYVGGFANGASNVGYVFEDALGNGNPRFVAEAATHEAGHLFGLSHQASWSGGSLSSEYNSGNGTWAPIMGVGYYADRTTWHRGPTTAGAASIQDDMSVLAGSANGFGFAADDFGSTTAAAAALPTSGGSVNVAGL